MDNSERSQSGSVVKVIGEFFFHVGECGPTSEGWLLTDVKCRVVRDDCGLVLKRVNVDTMDKQVAFFYAGSLSGCIRKYWDQEKTDSIQWRRDRF